MVENEAIEFLKALLRMSANSLDQRENELATEIEKWWKLKVPRKWYSEKEETVSYRTWLTVGERIKASGRQQQSKIWDPGRTRTVVEQ